MILADTSVWIDHLIVENPHLASLLDQQQVLIHPMVIGELACGNVSNRSEVFSLLRSLPQVPGATDDEVFFFIERHRFMGRGIGFIDAHLLAATTMAAPTRLWTNDRRLMELAVHLDVAYGQPRAER